MPCAVCGWQLEGRELVLKYDHAGSVIEVRLPADLEWIWNWAELLREACEALALRKME